MKKYEIIEHPLYEKAFKKLRKRYKNIESDIEVFLNNVKTPDDLGIELNQMFIKYA